MPKAKHKLITDMWCTAKWKRDTWINEGGSRGGGRLKAKRTQGGVVFYYQYIDKERRHFIRLGQYRENAHADGLNQRLDNENAPLSVLAARTKAAQLSLLYKEHRDLSGQLAQASNAQKLAVAEAVRVEEGNRHFTLQRLMDLYLDDLKKRERSSVKDATSYFRRCVTEAFPDLAGKMAGEITMDDAIKIIGRVADTGKMRAAGQLRSYLSAAYNLAVGSRTNPSASTDLRAFALQSNPIAPTASLSEHNKAKDRTLDVNELAAVLHRIDALPDDAVKDALTVTLALGGQRPKQFLRVKAVDVDLVAGTVLIKDPKGRRRQARLHLLPIVGPAKPIFTRLVKQAAPGGPLFTLRRAQLAGPRLSTKFTAIAVEMLAARELKSSATLGDVRRTCETMMAAMGVNSDTRAHVQSHGLGGVQKRHYNMHEYAKEKKEALVKWNRYLQRIKKNSANSVAGAKRVGVSKRKTKKM